VHEERGVGCLDVVVVMDGRTAGEGGEVGAGLDTPGQYPGGCGGTGGTGMAQDVPI
jgi:hypothetical protein